jgi:hypothetical protein
MSQGRGEQIENHMDFRKYGEGRRSRKDMKKSKRRRAKEDPECSDEYKKYDGYEY